MSKFGGSEDASVAVIVTRFIPTKAPSPFPLVSNRNVPSSLIVPLALRPAIGQNVTIPFESGLPSRRTIPSTGAKFPLLPHPALALQTKTTPNKWHNVCVRRTDDRLKSNSSSRIVIAAAN
jgi:hypothetical protein